MTEIPDDLVESVSKGQCILFLGAMVSAPSPKDCPYIYKEENAPPSGKALSRHLAQVSEYPADEDAANLQRVALHFEMRPNYNRRSLVLEIQKLIDNEHLSPSPALEMLAALPFPIIITTNYDRLFDGALWRSKTLNGKPKAPRIEVYNPKKEAAVVPLDNPENKPILLKLHGDLDVPESIVITEEDYLVFIQRMADEHMHPIPANIRARMQGWPVLFIGYSLKDFNLRLLLRSLRWGNDTVYPLSYSVDPKPDNLIVAVQQRSGAQSITFLYMDLWKFVPELYRMVRGDAP